MPDKIESINKSKIDSETNLPSNWASVMEANWKDDVNQPVWQKIKRTGKAWVTSSLGLGLFLLLSINSFLCFNQPFAKVDPAILPATHTWTWWATQEFLNDKPAPPVVLLGSSLFMHPIARQDADFLNKDFDYIHHHYSLYLSKQLRERFRLQQQPLCFNFSLPGDLVSDQYMVARSLFCGVHKPKYIILGSSLRDFIDDAVRCPGTTPPFRYLQRFTDISDIVNLAFPQAWQRIDYYFGKLFYPWAKRLDLQALTNEWAKKKLGPLTNACRPCLLNDLDYRKHAPATLHAEVEEGMDIIRPHVPASYDANFADYKRRYGTNNGNKYLYMFNIQKQFFCRLVDLCAKEKIKLIIVNMPLTKENVALMPVGSYELYMNLLKTEADKYKFHVFDLNADAHFVHSDFYDTAHMNSTGGKRLLDILAQIEDIKL